jgi:cystathionine gamma-synthase
MTDEDKQRGLSTRAIHGHSSRDAYGSPYTPIYNTTTFGFDATADLLDVIDGRKRGGLYTRYGLNPTIFALEETLAGLESAEAAWVFCSGMAALSALFLTHGRDGIACVGDAYGGTLELLEQQLPQLGLRTHCLLGSEAGQLDTLLDDGVRLVFLETPTNPTLEIADIRALAAKAHAHGALLAIDNTFASPVNQRPLELGADVVQHNAGAQAVAEAMQCHPRIARVYYPGLPGFPGHELAAAQMHGFGGMLSIDVKGSGADATAVADRLRLIRLAPSLGGVESLVTQPCTTTHHGQSAGERARRGISDSMLRLSIGLEDPCDLIADLDQALGT